MIRRFVLAAVLPVLLAHGIYNASGCAPALKTLDEVNDPADDAALKRCRDLARSIKADGGDAGAAFDAYYRCTEDAGLR